MDDASVPAQGTWGLEGLSGAGGDTAEVSHLCGMLPTDGAKAAFGNSDGASAHAASDTCKGGGDTKGV